MPTPRKSASGPKSKASRPEVHPLGEHLAELLNPALVEPKPQGFGEAPQPRFETPAPESHPRGLTGAAAQGRCAQGAPERGPPQHPHPPPVAAAPAAAPRQVRGRAGVSRRLRI